MIKKQTYTANPEILQMQQTALQIIFPLNFIVPLRDS